MDMRKLWQKPQPVIAMPLQGKNTREVIQDLFYSLKEGAQVLEWRLDFLEDLSEANLEETQRQIKNQLQTFLLNQKGNKEIQDYPLLITLRTKNQGGNRELDFHDYAYLLERFMDLRLGEMIDIEYHPDQSNGFQRLLQRAQKKGYLIVGSYHDFQKTPEEKVLIDTLKAMKNQGVDLPKVAYMAQDDEAVKRVQRAVARLAQENPFACVAIAMGEKGKVTRWKGNQVGVAMTYAKGKKSTAPGQLSAKELKKYIYGSGDVLV